MVAGEPAVNWSRLARWGFTTVVSLIPFLITSLMIAVIQPLGWEVLARQSQLLFVPLVLGITAIVDILTVLQGGRDPVLLAFTLLTSLLVVISGSLYGIHFAVMNIRGPHDLNLPLFFDTALVLMGVTILSTAIIQFKIARSEPVSYA